MSDDRQILRNIEERLGIELGVIDWGKIDEESSF